MTSQRTRFPAPHLELPAWLEEVLPGEEARLASDEERMALVVELSRQNLVRGTGGPFAAAVFEIESGRLLAPGVNLVEPANCSVAHAEMVALMVAQRLAGSFDLGRTGLPAYELVASTEPCAMCFGAVPWSGVRRLVCGARKEDAEAVGFDEGEKPRNWVASLESRGIEVRRDVLRSCAAKVLEEYRAAGRTVYNPTRPPSP